LRIGENKFAQLRARTDTAPTVALPTPLPPPAEDIRTICPVGLHAVTMQIWCEKHFLPSDAFLMECPYGLPLFDLGGRHYKPAPVDFSLPLLARVCNSCPVE